MISRVVCRACSVWNIIYSAGTEHLRVYVFIHWFYSLLFALSTPYTFMMTMLYLYTIYTHTAAQRQGSESEHPRRSRRHPVAPLCQEEPQQTHSHAGGQVRVVYAVCMYCVYVRELTLCHMFWYNVHWREDKYGMVTLTWYASKPNSSSSLFKFTFYHHLIT